MGPPSRWTSLPAGSSSTRQDAKGQGQGQEGRPEEGLVDAETASADGSDVSGHFCVI